MPRCWLWGSLPWPAKRSNQYGNQHWIFTGRTDAGDEAPINTLATWWEELTHLKRPWCRERLRAGGEGDSRGWDGCISSPAQWTRVWANSSRYWRTEKPDVLQSMRSQRVSHNLATEQKLSLSLFLCFSKIESDGELISHYFSIPHMKSSIQQQKCPEKEANFP